MDFKDLLQQVKLKETLQSEIDSMGLIRQFLFCWRCWEDAGKIPRPPGLYHKHRAMLIYIFVGLVSLLVPGQGGSQGSLGLPPLLLLHHSSPKVIQNQ